MSFHVLFDRLDSIKRTGNGQYMACCPAHDDRRPSLSVRECSDGRLLLHCFAGCDIEEIVNSLGLTFFDLMPDGPTKSTQKGVRRRSLVSPRDALQAIDHHSMIVACVASDLLRHKEIDEQTWTILANAVERIGSARDACCAAKHKP